MDIFWNCAMKHTTFSHSYPTYCSNFIISFFAAAESGKDSEQCPKVAFLPAISEKHGSCVLSNNCNKVKCVTQDNRHKFTITVKINKCDNPLTATVKLQQPDTDLDWSHTLKDGEKAKVPTKSSSFTGGLPVNNAALFIQVGLKKMNGTSVNYTVRRLHMVHGGEGWVGVYASVLQTASLFP